MRKTLPFFLLTILILVLPLRPSPEARTTEKDLLKLFDDVLRDVSRIRELPVKAPIGKGVRTKKQIRAMLKEEFDKVYASGKMETERLCLVKLGLIPADLKFGEFMVDLEAQQIAGYYLPEAKTFYIADWIPAKELKEVMVHELTHALQHQNYDMDAMMARIEGNDDRAMARLALLEGDATLVMFDHMIEPDGYSFTLPWMPNLRKLFDDVVSRPGGSFAQSEFWDDKLFKSAPLFFQESTIFPYISGVAFVQTFRKVKTWKQVNGLYTRVPKSTEQIMHMSKYLIEKDDPTEVEATFPEELSDAVWKQIYKNVFGEFGLGIVLRQTFDSGEAGRAAKGWDGDCVQLFQNANGKLALSMRSVWDTPYDANHFYKSYQAVISKKYPDAVRENVTDGVNWKSPSQSALIRLSGTQVYSLEQDL